MANAIDGLEIGYDRLQLQAEVLARRARQQNGESLDDIPFRQKSILLVDAWSIVDQAYALGELIKSLKLDKNSPISKFNELLGPTRKLRNKMEHISQNIDNLVAAKSVSTTVPGSLCFTQVENNDDGSHNVFTFVVAPGAFINQEHAFKVTDPRGNTIEHPVGLFELSAFNLTLNISELYNNTVSLRDLLNRKVGPSIIEGITKTAKERGEDVDAALLPRTSGFFSMLQGLVGSEESIKNIIKEARHR